MTDGKKNKCAHQNCSCVAGTNSKYCSPYCESAKDTQEIACACGHPGCMGKIA
jgi:hypothetical protein